MLIKNYAANGDLQIIEDVSDVNVPLNPDWEGYENAPWKVFDFDEVQDDKNPRVITYASDGPCVLVVRGIAYICSNDGKTIEKVVGNGCA